MHMTYNIIANFELDYENPSVLARREISVQGGDLV